MVKDVQSVIFNRKLWSIVKARNWLEKNGYKKSFNGRSPDRKTTNYYRFRQKRPNYKKYKTEKKEDGIEFIYGFK